MLSVKRFWGLKRAEKPRVKAEIHPSTRAKRLVQSVVRCLVGGKKGCRGSGLPSCTYPSSSRSPKSDAVLLEAVLGSHVAQGSNLLDRGFPIRSPRAGRTVCRLDSRRHSASRQRRNQKSADILVGFGADVRFGPTRMSALLRHARKSSRRARVFPMPPERGGLVEAG